MNQKTLLKLVYAFVISRITYIAFFLPLKQAERNQINNLIKRAHKQALGILIRASNEKLESLGVHNTLEELIEVYRIAHLERLTKTRTGRQILNCLRIPFESTFGEKHSVPAWHAELRCKAFIHEGDLRTHHELSKEKKSKPAVLESIAAPKAEG